MAEMAAAAPSSAPASAPAPSTGSSPPAAKSSGTPGTAGADSSSKSNVSSPTGSSGQESAPSAPAEQVFELAIDGQQRKYTLEQLKVEAQKAAAAQKRFREAAELTKKNQALFETATKGEYDARVKALQELGFDVDELAEKRMLARFEESQLTPEQKAQKELQAKLKEYETREQTREREAKEASQKAQHEATSKQVEQLMLEAAERAGMPKSPDTLIALAEIGDEAAQLGVMLTPEHLIAEYQGREAHKMEQFVSKLNGLDGEKLIKALPPGFVEKVLKASLAVHRAAAAPAPTPPAEDPTPAEPRAPRTPKSTDPHEFFSKIKFKF